MKADLRFKFLMRNFFCVEKNVLISQQKKSTAENFRMLFIFLCYEKLKHRLDRILLYFNNYFEKYTYNF